jgi:hypothetical protein
MVISLYYKFEKKQERLIYINKTNKQQKHKNNKKYELQFQV